MAHPFTIVIVAQNNRLQYEALLFAHALHRCAPDLMGALHVAEPQPGPLWPEDPRMDQAIRAALTDLGAKITPFDSRHFGAAYPHGNKIECLAALPAGRPFIFFDTDTLLLDDPRKLAIDFTRPAASMRREGTWPVPRPDTPTRDAIWRALYDQLKLDFDSSLDPAFAVDDWRRYLYFNAGWFFGPDPQAFGALFTDYALTIRDAAPPELQGQPLVPWLDQVALPLVIHALGGGRPDSTLSGLDGGTSCHWRNLPLLYARESDAVVDLLHGIATTQKVKKHLRAWEPARQMIYQGKGARARALFDRAALPPTEQPIRKALKAAGLWIT